MKKLISLLLAIALSVSLCSSVCSAAGEFMPYENSRFFEYGDYSIHYRISPAQGEIKGRIIMIHGFLCSTYSWRNMSEIMSRNGYECVMADLPDFGFSTRENEDMDIIERETILIALMEYLAPGEKWILAGHSMGGGVAINIAEEIEAEALLLYCPCAQKTFPPFAEKIVKSVPMKMIMNAFFNYGTRITPLVKLIILMATNNPDFARNYDVSGVTRAVQYDGFGAGMCEMMYNVRATDLDNTSKITCPVLLCNAEKDIILNDSQKGEIKEAFPDAEQYILQGAGHQCIEDRADELADLTLDFLEKNS